MSLLPFEINDKKRLAALQSYHILDTLEEKDFDDLTTLAATICNIPVALITLLDEKKQWFKSHHGVTVTETPLEQSFCTHALYAADDITVVEDAREDKRFKDNPLVTGKPNIAFYAGVPLVSEEGFGLGTLCVLDLQKRTLSEEQKSALKILAGQVMDKLELRRKVIELQKKNTILHQSEITINQLNEELLASNKKQVETNNELSLANRTLNGLQQTLEEALKIVSESEERFRNMAENSDILIAVSDTHGKDVYFNKPWAALTGISTIDLLQSGWAMLLHPEDKDRFANIYRTAFEKKLSWTCEFRLLNSGGNYQWLLATAPPRFNKDGSFAGYISSCIDITEQKKDEQRKNDFIGIVSHELKTPLTSLKATIQILQHTMDESAGKPLQAGLERAIKQVNKMNALINGFLNVSRLESGKIHVDYQHFDMAELIRETEEETRATIVSHQIIFEPVEDTFVNADRDKIGHVINNFISNAAKYSSNGSVINIACIAADGHTTVSVKDEGIGMEPEDTRKIFDRFYRIENKQTTTISGFGIGLYLSAEIIHRHNGKIWVESTPGEGSVFYFSIPTTD